MSVASYTPRLVPPEPASLTFARLAERRERLPNVMLRLDIGPGSKRQGDCAPGESLSRRWRLRFREAKARSGSGRTRRTGAVENNTAIHSGDQTAIPAGKTRRWCLKETERGRDRHRCYVGPACPDEKVTAPKGASSLATSPRETDRFDPYSWPRRQPPALWLWDLAPLRVQIPPSAPNLRKASICWPFSRFLAKKLTDS